MGCFGIVAGLCIVPLKIIGFHDEDIRKSENVDSKGHRLLFSMTDNSVDGIVGGPPCQAYSMAGRIRDPERMTKDYRNYLFESYIDWLKKIQPSFFVFENVTGMLSASAVAPQPV